VKLSAGGIDVDAGSMGSFQLSYPILLNGQGDVVHKRTQVDLANGGATVQYAEGAQAAVQVQGHQVSFAFSNVPADVQKLRIDSLIGFQFSDGGTWQMDQGAKTAFPVQKPDKPFLFQGNATSFSLHDREGRTISFDYAEPCFQQLQDNREWGWKTFDWFLIAMYHRDWPKHTISILGAVPAGGPKTVVVVDQFGQDAQANFPGKVTSADELKQDATEPLPGDPWTDRDVYGGLTGSQEKYSLKKTGYFHVEKTAGRWILVDPAGNAFFHLGVCAFGPGDDYTWVQGRRDIYAWIPPYDGEFHTAFMPEAYWSHDTISFYLANVIRKYGKPFDREEWTARMIDRVRRWGFTSSGDFSSVTEAHHKADFPYVAGLPINVNNSIAGLGGIFDPFDPTIPAQLDQSFAKGVTPSADDPLLIGYYLGNEQPFEDIPRVVAGLKANSPAKQHLLAMLKQKYITIDALNKAWGLSAASFDALGDMGLPISTQDAAADMAAFDEQFLEGYYSEIETAFRKADPNHMLIGSRWQPGTANSEALCRIAAKHLDVVSVNYYTTAFDRDFLTRLDGWAGGKPMFLSEWHYCSSSDSGLPGGGPEVKSQDERGLAYRNYLEQGASLPFVVGAEWFTLLDQARTGRFFERYNGENGNTGLYSVADRPYTAFLKHCLKTNDSIFQVAFGQKKPFVYDDPRFQVNSHTGRKTVQIPRATGPITLDGGRVNWPGIPPETVPGSRLVLGADAGGVSGVFRLCSDDEHLYLMVNVTDPTPMKNSHVGGDIWNGDGVEVFIGAEKPDVAGPLLFSDRQILLSAGKFDGKFHYFFGHSPQQYDMQMVVLPNVDGTGYTLEAAIPFTALDFKPKPGQAILFDLGIDDSTDGAGRTRQLMWNGGEKNSSDRSYWGQARFAE
jgi:hypothetical protein